MLASGASGRRWHVIDVVRSCLYGEVLRAVEVASSPFPGNWGPSEQRHFAIKVRDAVVVLQFLCCLCAVYPLCYVCALAVRARSLVKLYSSRTSRAGRQQV